MSSDASPPPTTEPIPKITLTIYDMDPILWQRFRLSVLQRGEKVNTVLQQAIKDWTLKYPPTRV